MAAAAFSLDLASNALPPAGVSTDGDDVTYVMPGGPAWELGLRPGQHDASLMDASAELWRIDAWDGADSVVVTKDAMVNRLRETAPFSVAALIIALAGLFVFRANPPTAAAAGVLGIALSRPALMAAGDLGISTVAALVAVILPAIWLLTWSGHRRASLLALLAGGSVALGWLILRFEAADLPDLTRAYDLSAIALITLTYLLVVAVVYVVGASAIRARSAGYDMRRLGDFMVVAVALVAIPLAVGSKLPLAAIAVVTVMVLAIYPLTRRRIGAALDRLVLGDLRVRSSVEAIERERQRVSREIHDQPLQELAVVIQRLAGRPDLVTETAMLQDVSGQLRGVTVQLHPPILADLGLGPSLEFLVEEVDREASATVRLELDESPDSGRPPNEVELAAFRVTQEALTNAVRHSAARTIRVRAAIRANAVTVDVADDGVGLDGVAVSQALARGHVGLRSMGERAQLVGADLRVEDAGPGTRVSFRWPA
jgi:signal transduction histidine kinase